MADIDERDYAEEAYNRATLHGADEYDDHDDYERDLRASAEYCDLCEVEGHTFRTCAARDDEYAEAGRSTLRTILTTLVVAVMLAIGVGHAAGAATPTYSVSVRDAGSYLVINVAGVHHDCQVLSSTGRTFAVKPGASVNIQCSPSAWNARLGTMVAYNSTGGGVRASLYLHLNSKQAYQCSNPILRSSTQVTCTAHAVRSY